MMTMDPKQRKQKALEKLDELYSREEPDKLDIVDDAISASVSSSYSESTGVKFSDVFQMIMMFLVVVIMIFVGGQVLASVETSQTTVGVATSDLTINNFTSMIATWGPVVLPLIVVLTFGQYLFGNRSI